MIANAMPAGNSFTAAQISQKLKQLGLRLPQQERSEAKLHLIDDEPSSLSTGGHDSDDETLLSLRNRYLISQVWNTSVLLSIYLIIHAI